MDNLRTKLITFCKAQCSAWIASAIDFGTTIILAHVFGLWYGYSTFIGALNGGIANCLINYRWVFHAFEMKKGTSPYAISLYGAEAYCSTLTALTY